MSALRPDCHLSEPLTDGACVADPEGDDAGVQAAGRAAEAAAAADAVAERGLDGCGAWGASVVTATDDHPLR
jgi:hypothetical protein